MKKNIIYSFWSWLKIASLSRQELQLAGTAKWSTTLRFGKILGTTSVVKVIVMEVLEVICNKLNNLTIELHEVNRKRMTF